MYTFQKDTVGNMRLMLFRNKALTVTFFLPSEDHNDIAKRTTKKETTSVLASTTYSQFMKFRFILVPLTKHDFTQVS